jgi:hypothetical protein
VVVHPATSQLGRLNSILQHLHPANPPIERQFVTSVQLAVNSFYVVTASTQIKVSSTLQWTNDGVVSCHMFGEVGNNVPTLYYAQNFVLKKGQAGNPLDPAISIPINVIQTLQPPHGEQVFFECKATFGLNGPKFIPTTQVLFVPPSINAFAIP